MVTPHFVAVRESASAEGVGYWVRRESPQSSHHGPVHAGSRIAACVTLVGRGRLPG
jgi:hypothetical protein